MFITSETSRLKRTHVDLRGFARCCELDTDSRRVVVSVDDQASRVPAQLQRDRYWTAYVFVEKHDMGLGRTLGSAEPRPLLVMRRGAAGGVRCETRSIVDQAHSGAPPGRSDAVYQ